MKPDPHALVEESLAFMRTFTTMTETELYEWSARYYSFSVPTTKALEAIAKHGPILDVGAGNGYWIWRLQRLGVDAIGIEPMPAANIATETIRGNHTLIPDFPNRSLLLVWPTKANPWPMFALEAYEGDTVLYIGDPAFRETATPAFRSTLLARGYKLRQRVDIDSWPGYLLDQLQIWQRK